MTIMMWILVLDTSMTNIAHAECTPAPDCVELGYTETSCEGKFVRCPFDTSKLFCLPCDSSYKYTCSGTGEIGSGTACNGKYIECECADGYELIDGACVCDSSYQFSCSGTGYAGGSGTSCGGKYTACTCINDGTSCYVWNGSACTKGTCATGSLEPETPGIID